MRLLEVPRGAGLGGARLTRPAPWALTGLGGFAALQINFASFAPVATPR